MSSLLLAGLKIGFLVALWIFILAIANVVRTDLFGRRIKTEELKEEAGAPVADPNLPTLVIIASGVCAGRCTALPAIGQEITIGRANSCDLDLGDDYASGQHARIWRDAEGFILEDLRSTNGTFLNGHRITEPVRLNPDDTIRIGRSQLQLGA